MFRFLFAGLLTAGLVAAVGQPGATQDTKDKTKKKEKPPKFSINDPAKLKDDADFAVQGEYEGLVAMSTGKKRFGAQVVAKGKGEFDVRILPGGLPGDGWDGTEIRGTAKRGDDGAVVIAGDKLKGAIGDGKLTFDGGTLMKTVRKSPTLGEKPPAGASILYGRSDDADKFEGATIVELSDGKFLAATNPRSKQKFGSFTMHLEFRTPWMPDSTGQQRGNSGVYIQDRYELQVLDSFGLKGVDNECGGIYKESSPKVNMCFPPMSWQTYDIDFTAAEFGADGKKTKPAVVSVRHNGVTIHDKLELKSNTPGGKFNKEVPEPGSLFLQNHGDPVVFNNIWVVAKSLE